MRSHSEIAPITHGESADDAGAVVYGVHGRTQSPEFIRELADRVNLPGLHWVIPSAADHSWYPGGFMADPEENQPQLGEALAVVDAQLGRLLADRDAGGPPVVVLGFSQGACLLAEYLLTRQPRVDGAVLHTGGYMGPDVRSFAPASGAPLRTVSVELFCADEDPWVPLHRAKETASAFEALAAATTLTVYRDSEHHITDHAVSRIRPYLQEWLIAQ
ncbi:alpha/beta hydrolase [Nesterenkonia sp. NBAIMH1]|uniref:alpha/beta hydrolase n=1 Tax=Nesterenkonia sp. NBAIMH1 TaxID=2600320 RepID=UPI00143DF3BC|nr:alpha/beta hydrolase [Nesterenkonia sp. NBAIMH1]